MEIGEKIQLAGFEVLEQAEGGVWRGKGATGEKQLQHVGSKGSDWVYTQLYREAQKGNPG